MNKLAFKTFLITIKNLLIIAYLTFRHFLHQKPTKTFLLFFTISISLITILTFGGILPYPLFMSALNVCGTFSEVIIISVVMILGVRKVYLEKSTLEEALYLEKKSIIRNNYWMIFPILKKRTSNG